MVLLIGQDGNYAVPMDKVDYFEIAESTIGFSLFAHIGIRKIFLSSSANKGELQQMLKDLAEDDATNAIREC